MGITAEMEIAPETNVHAMDINADTITDTHNHEATNGPEINGNDLETNMHKEG